MPTRSNDPAGVNFDPNHTPLLYTGPTEEYYCRVSPQRVITTLGRPFVSLDGDGELRIGMGHPQPERTIHESISTPLSGRADLVGAYHAASMLVAIRHLNGGDTLHQITHLARRHTCCNKAEGERIRQTLGDAKLAEIMALVPPDFDEALGLLEREGVEIDKLAIERELLEGVLPFSSPLELRGVRHPNVILAQRAKGQQLVAPYDDLITGFLDWLSATRGMRRDRIEPWRTGIRQQVLDGIAHDLNDPVMLLGFAIVTTLRHEYREPIIVMSMARGEDVSAEASAMALFETATYLATAFPTKPAWPSVLLRALKTRCRPSQAIRLATTDKYTPLVLAAVETVTNTPAKELEAEL